MHLFNVLNYINFNVLNYINLLNDASRPAVLGIVKIWDS